MAGLTSTPILLAEGTTTSGDALQQGQVIAPQDSMAATAQMAPAADTTHAATAGTHAATEAHSEVFPPFDPSSFGGQLLWLAITFAALYVLMSRVALPQIGSIIDTRKARIEADLKEAERLRQETEKAAAAYEAARAEAQRNAQKIAEDTRASIKQDIDNRRAEVEAGLAQRMSDAEARIAVTKTAALTNVADIAAETAEAVVARIIGTGVSSQDVRDAVAAASKE
jgi:F-type H+-transporting ATPase subunit b